MPGLTDAQMISLLNSTLSKFLRDKFISTQKLQQYAVCEKFILTSRPGVSLDSHTFEWTVRLRANEGSFRGVNFHEPWQAVEGPEPVRARVPTIKYEGKGIVIDRREKAMNAGPEAIIDVLRFKTDAFFEEVFNVLEQHILSRPVSQSDTVRLWGLGMWARPSMTSTGTFVSDPTGSFGGTYIRYQDGTVSSILAGIDAANVVNERWRNWCFTHSGVMDFSVCEAIRRANNYTGFRAFPRKIGTTVMGNCSIFMNQAFHEQYLTLVNLGPDDRGVGPNRADIFPYQDGSLNGVNIIRTPQLDFDSMAPIYGVRHDQVYLARMPGFWFKRNGFREMPNAHNSLYDPMDVCCNMIVTSPREAIWIGHGSF